MGRLEVRICGARHIGDTQKVGIPDPYVKIIMGDDKKTQIKYKTKVVNNSLNPEWNEVSKFQIADYNSAQVVFEVWNDNVMVDDLMGSYRLSVNGLTRGVVHDMWAILTGARLSSAEIHLQVLAVDFGIDPQPGSRVVRSIEEYIAASAAAASGGAAASATSTVQQSDASADYDSVKKPTPSNEPAMGIPLQAQPVPAPVMAPPQPQYYPPQQQPQYYQPQQQPQYYQPQQQQQFVYAQQAPPPPPQQVVYYQQAPPPAPQPGYYAAPPPQPGYYAAAPPQQQYSYGPPRL